MEPPPTRGTAISGQPAIEELLQVMARLRGPEGCPWDRKQTHRSLLPYLIEEAYELIDAVELDSREGIREELGDVLLQVVFHAQIAEERGEFTFSEIAGALTEKLRRRHPHVFSKAPLETAEEVSQAWHRQKMAGRNSALEGVPNGQPALQWAFQIGSRAARTGFEWDNTEDIHGKILEELNEFREATQNAKDAEDDHKQEPAGERGEMEMEFGDLLFAMVQMARWQGIDPEQALRKSTRKFIARFQWMEEALREQGQQPGGQSSQEWWALWHEAKTHAD